MKALPQFFPEHPWVITVCEPAPTRLVFDLWATKAAANAFATASGRDALYSQAREPWPTAMGSTPEQTGASKLPLTWSAPKLRS
jgi:hypothetical protein